MALKKKKNITLDELAMMVARGFSGQDEKFATVDRRFDDIDQKFDAIDRRFDAVDQRFDLQDARFDAIDQKFAEQDARFDELDEKYNRIMDILDKITKLLETYHQEHLSLGVKVDRHEEWIKQIADKLGVQLKY